MGGVRRPCCCCRRPCGDVVLPAPEGQARAGRARPKNGAIRMNRAPVATLVLSGAVLVGLAVSEGYRDTAYTPVPGDALTIGFGETSGVKLGERTTPVRALIRLQESAEKHAQGVRQCAPYPMLQREFDSFVSLA